MNNDKEIAWDAYWHAYQEHIDHPDETDKETARNLFEQYWDDE